jgi:hypothetical protein
MEFVAKKRRIKVVLDSGEYLIGAPSIRDIQTLDEALKARQSDEEAILIYADFLANLGLPKDELLQLDASLFTELVQFVTTPQKKS